MNIVYNSVNLVLGNCFLIVKSAKITIYIVLLMGLASAVAAQAISMIQPIAKNVILCAKNATDLPQITAQPVFLPPS